MRWSLTELLEVNLITIILQLLVEINYSIKPHVRKSKTVYVWDSLSVELGYQIPTISVCFQIRWAISRIPLHVNSIASIDLVLSKCSRDVMRLLFQDQSLPARIWWFIVITANYVHIRGGSRVVQVICTNHSNFFQILFLSSLLLLTKSITFLVLLFIMKLTKQLRDYSVDHTANPAPPERSGRVTVRAVSSFVDLSRTTRKKFRRHDRTKFLPRG